MTKRPDKKMGTVSRKKERLGHLQVHPLVRWLIILRGTPEAIGLGVAIGMFVAFTPTIGFQIVLAAFLATVLKASRPAAVVPVWITNPATIPPIFAFTYWVGNLICAGPPASTVQQTIQETMKKLVNHDFWSIPHELMTFLAIGRNILVPLLIGGVLVGLVAGGLSYVITVGTLRTVRRRRQTRRERRVQRSAAAKRASGALSN